MDQREQFFVVCTEWRLRSLYTKPSCSARLTSQAMFVHAATIVGQGNASQRSVFGGGTDKMVHKWSLATGEWSSVLTGHVRDIHAVCGVPDQPVVLSTGRDGLLKIW